MEELTTGRETPAIPTYDRGLVAAKLRRWERFLEGYALPSWEELPDFGLYMDQVVALLSRYLDFIPVIEDSDKAITVSAVNNYVRLKVMPAPVKKKYGRSHLAYLLMICILKQNLSIAYVQKLIPMGLTEDEVRIRYEAFVRKHKETSLFFIQQVLQSAEAVLRPEGETADVDGLITAFAIYTSLSRILTEKLLNLQGKVQEPAESTPAV